LGSSVSFLVGEGGERRKRAVARWRQSESWAAFWWRVSIPEGSEEMGELRDVGGGAGLASPSAEAVKSRKMARLARIWATTDTRNPLYLDDNRWDQEGRGWEMVRR